MQCILKDFIESSVFFFAADEYQSPRASGFKPGDAFIQRFVQRPLYG
jgi:hypothetical protein